MVSVTYGPPRSVQGSEGDNILKVAVTFVSELSVIVQGPVPEHAPLQPAKKEPEAGVAVRVMLVPASIGQTVVPEVFEQSNPQGMPVLVTAPCPVPNFVTLRAQ